MSNRKIKTGKIIMQSPLTGIVYRVTKWRELGDSKVVALEKEPLPDSCQWDDIEEL